MSIAEWTIALSVNAKIQSDDNYQSAIKIVIVIIKALHKLKRLNSAGNWTEVAAYLLFCLLLYSRYYNSTVDLCANLSRSVTVTAQEFV